ncbi:hypothetical protein F7725_007205 [Dissostichus mawsoni]|uniref:Uncharacterized protein n=1 Tax=Dissostichus mawsoni TaxID=36200 RepID=A0A7J5XX52_DISMA|nr:hypothetical protein F7725_007205 [Dissostichus mawsoni]
MSVMLHRILRPALKTGSAAVCSQKQAATVEARDAGPRELCVRCNYSLQENKQSTIQPRILWNSDTYKKANIPSAKWESFMSCDDEVKNFLRNYLLYGIAFVDDVPATVEATEAVTQRVSLIRY